MNFKEFFQLAGKGITNFDKIAEGVWNEIAHKRLNPEQKEEIAKRTEACANCPFNSENAQTSDEYFKLYGENYKTSRKEPHCALCGCVLKFKVSSLSSNCGIEIHNQRYPDKKQPLKWKAFKVFNFKK